MQVIIHNDDLGLSYGFTEAIEDSYLLGNTSSTSVRLNGIAYRYALKLLRSSLKGIGVGLHLNLTDGPSLTENLADTKGNYKYSFPKLVYELGRNQKTLKFIEKDLTLQIVTAKKDRIKIDHLDSQEHIHMIPAIFEIVCRLAKKFQIKGIRLTREPYHLNKNVRANLKPIYNSNLIKFLILNYFSSKNLYTLKKFNLYTTDAFYGVLHTNGMDLGSIKSAIIDAKKRKFNTIEILGHPAYSNNPKDKTFTSISIEKYIKSKERKIETKTFTNKNLLNFLKSQNIQIISYDILPAKRGFPLKEDYI